jgi:ribosomal protein S18 acetylase RimI-like enzyme
VPAGLTLRELDRAQFLANLEACAGGYAAAMTPPPEHMPGYAAFRAIAAIVLPDGEAAGSTAPRRRVVRRQARGTTALAGETADGARPLLVGFTYGFHGSGGQWWHDVVRRAATSTLGARTADDWLDDSLEIAEVHVRPGYQGRGTGLAMMLRLTAGRPERAAVLSTMDANTRARRLYRGLGFTDLLTGFEFPGTDLPYAIMGAPLPLPGAAPDSARPGKPSR